MVSPGDVVVADLTMLQEDNGQQHHPLPTRSKPSGRRKELNLVEKMQLITRYEGGNLSQRQLARDFNISLGQVNATLKRKAEIATSFYSTDNVHVPKKRIVKSTMYESINALVFEWYLQAKAKGISINGRILKEKALQLAKEADPSTNFRGSNGWLNSFTQRNSIRFPRSSGQSPTASIVTTTDYNDTDSRLWNVSTKHLLKDYYATEIYAVIDLSLLGSSLPFENASSSDSFSLLLACNAAGQKENPLVVGNTNNRISAEIGVSLDYDASCWITKDIFVKWISNWNKILLQSNRKILLLVSKLPFVSATNLSQIKVVEVSQDIHSHFQGIFRYFKTCYRLTLLQHLVSRMTLGVAAQTDEIPTYRMLYWISNAWKEVPKIMIQQALSLVSCSSSDITEYQEVELSRIREINELIQHLSTLYYSLESPQLMSAENYVDFDRSLPTHARFEGPDWESQLVQQHQQGKSATTTTCTTDEHAETNASNEEESGNNITVSKATEMLDSLQQFALLQEPAMLQPLNQLSCILDRRVAHGSSHTSNESIANNDGDQLHSPLIEVSDVDVPLV